MTERGVIVGKFYPPHRGHKYLIDTGQAQVDRLTVIICWKPGENPPGWLRAAWLKEIHPEVKVIALEDTLPGDDSRAWAENTIKVLGYVPEVVFTSEDYGYPYAAFMGSRHVQVDKARRVVPVSGTAVRANPLKCWDYLEPCVRAFYARRVCLVGAESTGKTTLAAALAAHYRTNWVAEYGREYSEKKLLSDHPLHWESE
jgi:NadR type nicotinamide-nucleotide adenylyltransferase